MVVAARALESEPKEGRGHGLHPVADVFHTVLFLHAAALAFLLVQAVEGGGEDLLIGGVRQQVAGELPGDEFVEGQVFIEGLDHPVTPGPDRPLAVHLKAIAVGIACQIKPVHRHALAVALRIQEAVNKTGISIGHLVSPEGGQIFRRRRKAGEIESHTTNESLRAGLRLQLQPPVREPAGDEIIDALILAATLVLQGNEGPVRLILRAFRDPLFKGCDLGGSERCQLRLGGGHVIILVGRQDAFDHLAVVRPAGNDCLLAHGALALIKAQLGLTFLGIGTVAEEAFVRQDRPDVAIELQLAGRMGGEAVKKHQESDERAHVIGQTKRFGSVQGWHHAKTSRTTREDSTPVRRWSRP